MRQNSSAWLQSRRHGEAFLGLIPPNKATIPPQIKIWNIIN